MKPPWSVSESNATVISAPVAAKIANATRGGSGKSRSSQGVSVGTLDLPRTTGSFFGESQARLGQKNTPVVPPCAGRDRSRRRRRRTRERLACGRNHANDETRVTDAPVGKPGRALGDGVGFGVGLGVGFGVGFLEGFEEGFGEGAAVGLGDGADDAPYGLVGEVLGDDAGSDEGRDVGLRAWVSKVARTSQKGHWRRARSLARSSG